MEYLEYILKGLVSHPEDVKIEKTVDPMGVLLSVTLNPEDMGKVIGRNGNTAHSVREIMKVYGMMKKQRISMKIIDPAGVRFIKENN